MEDRANIIIRDKEKYIYLYTKDEGEAIAGIVADALNSCVRYWDDGPYVAAAIFATLVEEVGGHRHLRIDTARQESDGSNDITVIVNDGVGEEAYIRFHGKQYSFMNFLKEFT